MELQSGTLEIQQDGTLQLHAHQLLPSVAIPPDWASIMRIDDLQQGVTISCWDGQPHRTLDVEAHGPAMFCIGIFLEGEAHMAVDGGPLLRMQSGMAVIQTGDRPVSGRFCMAGNAAIRMVDIRFTPAALMQAGGRPLMTLQREFLQDCSVPAAGALLGGMKAPPALLRIGADMLNCDFDNGALRTLYLHAKALEALAVMLQHLQRTPQAEVGTRERRQILQAQQLLNERYDEEWSIDRLAQTVGLNEKKLQAGFRAMAGRTVHAHLREVRLSAAAEMLARGVSVSDTAHAVGFANLSHFSKSFREAMGTSPRDWQQRAPEAVG
jgi:AraC-like DNA-binding protein